MILPYDNAATLIIIQHKQLTLYINVDAYCGSLGTTSPSGVVCFQMHFFSI